MVLTWTMVLCAALMIICGIVALIKPEKLVSRVNRNNPEAVRKSRQNSAIYFMLAFCCLVPLIKAYIQSR